MKHFFRQVNTALVTLLAGAFICVSDPGQGQEIFEIRMAPSFSVQGTAGYVYEFIVSGPSTEYPVDILIDVDGSYDTAVNAARLPATFLRSFRGLKSGAHEVKITVEGEGDAVLATETFTLAIREQ